MKTSNNHGTFEQMKQCVDQASQQEKQQAQDKKKAEVFCQFYNDELLTSNYWETEKNDLGIPVGYIHNNNLFILLPQSLSEDKTLDIVPKLRTCKIHALDRKMDESKNDLIVMYVAMDGPLHRYDLTIECPVGKDEILGGDHNIDKDSYYIVSRTYIWEDGHPKEIKSIRSVHDDMPTYHLRQDPYRRSRPSLYSED